MIGLTGKVKPFIRSMNRSPYAFCSIQQTLGSGGCDG